MFGTLLLDVPKQVLHDRVDVQREQNPPAQRPLVEQRRDFDPIRREEALHQPDQLDHEVVAVPDSRRRAGCRRPGRAWARLRAVLPAG